jgi:hypothetical protein
MQSFSILAPTGRTSGHSGAKKIDVSTSEVAVEAASGDGPVVAPGRLPLKSTAGRPRDRHDLSRARNSNSPSLDEGSSTGPDKGYEGAEGELPLSDVVSSGALYPNSSGGGGASPPIPTADTLRGGGEGEIESSRNALGSPFASASQSPVSKPRPEPWVPSKRTVPHEGALASVIPFVVSSEFVDEIARWKPELVDDPSLFALFAYLSLGSNHHRDLHALQLPIELLAELAGVLTERVRVLRTSSEGLALLERMQLTLGVDELCRYRLGWSGYSAGRHPRMVTRFVLPAQVEAAVRNERRRHGCEKTLLVRDRLSSEGFRTCTKSARASFEKQLNVAVNPQRSDCAYEASLVVARHLDGLATKAFSTSIQANWNSALEVIDRRWELELGAANRMPPAKCRIAIDAALHRKEMAERQLASLAVSCKPRYSMTANSARLFPIGSSLCSHTSDIRRALTGDWIEVDLEAMNIGAAPLFLDVPATRSLPQIGSKHLAGPHRGHRSSRHRGNLSRGFPRRQVGYQARGPVSMPEWPDAVWMRQETERALRRELGAALHLTADLVARLIPEGVGQRFVEHPFVGEMIAAWQTFSARVNAVGYAEDHSGRRIGLPHYDGPADYLLQGDAKPATLLSFLFSCVEMDLMKAVVDLEQAQDGARFNVMLWQHDGATIRINRPNHYRPAAT